MNDAGCKITCELSLPFRLVKFTDSCAVARIYSKTHGGPIKPKTQGQLECCGLALVVQRTQPVAFLSTANPERDEIHVSALPQSLSVAGEWYLTVPGYSAAPDVGLQIIKLLTTHDAELTRLRARNRLAHFIQLL